MPRRRVRMLEKLLGWALAVIEASCQIGKCIRNDILGNFILKMKTFRAFKGL